jgi:primosomal protein N' (replication factor Y)
MTGHFSDSLIDAITNAVTGRTSNFISGGYSPLLECLTCGHVPQCQQCDVSLTYHSTRINCDVIVATN